MLTDLTIGEDGIYSYDFNNQKQAEEINLREQVANQNYGNYLVELSKHHSIPVMDREIELFLCKIPENGLIIDVGGCWGWHWRNIQIHRPDVKIYIIDFIRSNLHHAQKLLGNIVNKNVFLIHGDATNLIFKENSFHGYWSVQTLQHIPDFQIAIKEAYRVLKKDGVFANYSLNTQPIIKLIYKLIRKNYHIKGNIPGFFYLERASKEQLNIIRSIFKNTIKTRFTEIFFKPELKISFAGTENSFFGKIDVFLSNNIGLFSSIARQRSFHTKKMS